MLDFVPNPVAFQIGPIPVLWYGIGYAVGLAVAYYLLIRLARVAGEDERVVGNGIIVVAIAALIGGRLYHVIDQWALYKDDLIKIIQPPYSGLGVYGGIVAGFIAVVLYARWKGVPFWRWTDIIAPALFTMQAIARWGNFFNQELYGPPTTLPWGIPIECIHRIEAYPCAQFPFDTTRFQPLFLYESLSGLIGAVVLIWLGFHARKWLRAGDLLLLFFVWYGLVRFGLESLRSDNWTFYGIPVAQLVSAIVIVASILALLWKHRRGHPLDDPPSHPEVATWGAIGRPVEPPAFENEAPEDDDGTDDDAIEADDAEETTPDADASEDPTAEADSTEAPERT